MPDRILSARQANEVFFRENPHLDRRLIRDYEGTGWMFKADTRVAFVAWVDAVQKDGMMSATLAERVTLDQKFGRKPRVQA